MPNRHRAPGHEARQAEIAAGDHRRETAARSLSVGLEVRRPGCYPISKVTTPVPVEGAWRVAHCP
jgi:hypothetical protein